jgi:hypothetical protein
MLSYIYIAGLRTRFTGPPSRKKRCYNDLDLTLHNTRIQAQHRNVYKSLVISLLSGLGGFTSLPSEGK